MSGRRFLPLFLILAVAAGCERSVDPSIVGEDRALVPHGAPNTLPILFEEALRVAHRRQGPEALESALDGWAARQAEVRAAHSARDPLAVQAQLQSLRAEEIRFVLNVLGPDVITRVLSESNVALAEARRRLIEAGKQGAQTDAAEASAQEISELLSRATALAATNQVQSLDLATEAAHLLSGIDDAIVELRRLRGVETLFPEIAAELKADELRRHVRLQSEAHAALRAGDRHEATQKLAAVRNEEIRLVLKARGNEAARALLQQVQTALGELRMHLAAEKAGGVDAVRRERMLATAQDLFEQGRTAAQRGDYHAALDLGSHAAGLLNSLRHLLVK